MSETGIVPPSAEKKFERRVQAEFPPAFMDLFQPARYKVFYGGRGSGKSWNFGRALLLKCLQKPTRVLCAREFQNSIKDSVHKLLSDQIEMMDLRRYYEVQNTTILGSNGSEFIFEGMRHNIQSIKSIEGIDICWVEEAQTVSKISWDVLIPTIRKPDSEIWISFNPELDTDETYRRFVVNPPSGAMVRKVIYKDNPFFSETLLKEMEDLRARDTDAYLHVWEGHCRQALEGAVYAEELRAAVSEGRITKVPYSNTKPVHTFWDLGWRDKTAIWFAQKIGFEYRILDYMEDSQKTLEFFVRKMQEKNYIYGIDYLPHDADHETISANGKSLARRLRDMGRSVKVLKRMPDKNLGIEAVRSIFPYCYFDESKTSAGLQCLRRYRYGVREGVRTRSPLHDEFSHGADAFAQLALSISDKGEIDMRKGIPLPQTAVPKTFDFGMASLTGWMR